LFGLLVRGVLSWSGFRLVIHHCITRHRITRVSLF